MTATLAAADAKRALLDRLIDDASLFTPAELGMGAALRAHARDRESAYAFVQGRFVVPASRSTELLVWRESTLALRLSAILDVPAGADPLEGALARLAALAVFDGVDGIALDSLELRLPADVADVARIGALVDVVAERGGVALWAEPRYVGGWTAAPAATLTALAALQASDTRVAVGAKLRTGGLGPDAIPSVDDVAAFIVAAQQAGVRWKATAGLHHAVRRARDPHRGLPMHGFLNVFIAACALHAGAIGAERVVEIVAEEDPRAFVVDPAHVAWRDATLDAEAVVAARAHAVSFGSCSFFEPVDDLRRLGLLA